jgi:4-amino-4-deoxy-L-arabinose transferase-like glycosyltransferase
MTKGPVGLLLPSIILFSFFFLCDANKSTLKFLNIPLGALLMSIIALPWFVIEIYVTNGAYFQEFIMRENFARFTSVVDSHKGPWFYHIAAILGGLFPWSILLPQSLYKITKRLLSNLNIPKNINPLKKFQNAAYDFTVTDKALLLASLGSLITICFFSASVSKLLPYTLPAFPLLAIIIAFQWHTFIESKKQKSIFIYGLTISFIYFVAVFVSPFALKFLRDAPPTLITLIFWYASLMGTSTFIFTLVATRRSMILGSNLLFGMMILSGAIFLPLFLSVICDHWEGDIPKYAKSISKTQKPLIIYKLRKPGIPFYFGRKVIQINDTADLIQTTKNLGVCYLITKHKYLTDVANNGFRVLEERDNFALLSTTNK